MLMFHYPSVRKTIKFLHLSLDFQFENTTAGQKPPTGSKEEILHMTVLKMERWGQKLELKWKVGLGQ